MPLRWAATFLPEASQLEDKIGPRNYSFHYVYRYAPLA